MMAEIEHRADHLGGARLVGREPPKECSRDSRFSASTPTRRQLLLLFHRPEYLNSGAAFN
jgi:hypothetical protein